MIEGDSIIMPIDIVTVATIMSMTRNGSTMRKPISKPRRISEIMKAGIRMRRSITALVGRLDARLRQVVEHLEVLVADLPSMNLRNGSTIFG